MRNGIYRTTENNSAYVPGPNAIRAFDLDQQEWISIEMVKPHRLLRAANSDDRRQAASARYYSREVLL